MIDRRQLLAFSAATVSLPWASLRAQTNPDIWGAGRGYPIGLAGGLNRERYWRVGNYSGGYEKIFPFHTIRAAGMPMPMVSAPRNDLFYRFRFSERTPQDYLQAWPITGLLISRGDQIWFESQRFDRTPEMRMTSWSMAKSVTSLLLGICLDQRLIESYNDVPARYVPALRDTLHGQVSLRHLSNMCSGANVNHDRDNPVIYPKAFMGSGASVRRTVSEWNVRREAAGTLYNYNELCPLTIGLVIRAVTGVSLSEFAEKILWQPLGAEADATWTCDREGQEFNCIGFAARLRDWARLGRLVAQRGHANGRQIVSEAWINECTHWGEQDQAGRHGIAMPQAGYKAHMWHARADGKRLYFNGHHGQRVLIDMPTQTVMVQTAVEHEGPWFSEMLALMDACAKA